MNRPYRPFDGDAWLGRDIPLIGGPYRIVPETAFAVAEEMAFARQGRKARVFKLRGPAGRLYALKTFYRGFRLPEYVTLTESLRAFGDIDGLRTCQRRVIGVAEAGAVGEPGLAYAVLMPWIDGVSWAGVVEGRFPLPAPTCHALAARTADVLAALEARGIVHADISSSNVLVISTDDGPAIELIDVEDMYHDSLPSLPYVPDGSPGYAHPRNQGKGCRNKYGDRFAGAVLLAEMISWHDAEVRQSAGDVSVFEPNELCRGGAKYERVHAVLHEYSPDVAKLFERVWDSPGPSRCPRLADWSAAIAGGTAGTDHAPAAQSAESSCPGCGRPVGSGTAHSDHSPACPLRDPTTARPARPVIPGVPAHDSIAFIPVFRTE